MRPATRAARAPAPDSQQRVASAWRCRQCRWPTPLRESWRQKEWCRALLTLICNQRSAANRRAKYDSRAYQHRILDDVLSLQCWRVGYAGEYLTWEQYQWHQRAGHLNRQQKQRGAHENPDQQSEAD